ncbi:capsular polysaccharide biosynthesis protein [Fulvitalea axinellae]|uniref:Capsular polysaccharide biosynthesis protein n=1 Tax=Fulvitalea axinellae TaxID=1182444 RepID=A0AAU9DAW4_9BACT|nr:capsular polysaccharide biosynthesis protein [Fulvitalea axinellae]
MRKRLIKKYSKRYIARQFIFIADMVLVAGMLALAFLLRYNWSSLFQMGELVVIQTFYFLGLNAVSFLAFKTFEGVIRHTSIEDIVRVLTALSLVACLAIVGTFTGRYFSIVALDIPLGVILIAFILSAFVLNSFRILIKAIYWEYFEADKAFFDSERRRVMIYGAGEMGVVALTTLQNTTRNLDLNFEVVGFVDDNPYKTGKAIQGVKIYRPSKVFTKSFIAKKNIDEVIIAIEDLPSIKKRKIVDRALEAEVEVKVIPPVKQWVNGEFSPAQIKNIRIEDLLDRAPIRLDNENVLKEVSGKVVLITGAAGSIGSEIVRQVLNYQPKQLVLVDQAESALYDLQMEILRNRKEGLKDVEAVVADISRYDRIEMLFEEHRPELVFHAAAYKHVPLMEENPFEATRVNVFGTKNIADLSVKYGADKFVMVSTDKAVNPTNVMGASKRIAECYTQSLNGVGKTRFITTRFGNVLGSNGSVIPLFKKQIEEGGPLTVTHKDIIRYFMTIPEACQLVLEAGVMGEGGEIFIFDMGDPVRIYDLAVKMIKLSGLEPEKDIEIVFSGLRPGEKLYEELLNNKENTLPTHHEKIMRAEVRVLSLDEVKAGLERLSVSMSTLDNHGIVREMKSIVPEFRSKNSIYETLDV